MNEFKKKIIQIIKKKLAINPLSATITKSNDFFDFWKNQIEIDDISDQ